MRVKIPRVGWPVRWPLRWRITAASASLTFLILLIFGAVVGNLVADRVHHDFNRELENSASSLVHRSRIVEKIFESGVSSPELRRLSLPSDSAARLVSTDGVVVESTPTNGLEFGPVKEGVAESGDVAVATVAVTGSEQVVGFVQYARSTESVDETITKLWIFIFGGVVGGTALAFLAGLALASRAMRPVASLTAMAREVASTQDPSRKLPAPSADDEVGELTETLQRMLDALDAARKDREVTLQRQREFVADASHELRTPLTSVLANLELLEAQLSVVKDSEEHEVVTSAVRSSQRMSRLVSDLLFLARSDAGQKREHADCDLGEIARSAAREVAPKLAGRDLNVEQCQPAPVRGNQDDLHRLVLNLLDNAIRYTPPTAQIIVRTSLDGDSATVEVADNGPGIASDMRERVFERFVRSGVASDTNPTEGTGLGLAMVRAIAADHHGTAVAGASQELGGASLLVVLPRRLTDRGGIQPHDGEDPGSEEPSSAPPGSSRPEQGSSKPRPRRVGPGDVANRKPAQGPPGSTGAA